MFTYHVLYSNIFFQKLMAAFLHQAEICKAFTCEQFSDDVKYCILFHSTEASCIEKVDVCNGFSWDLNSFFSKITESTSSIKFSADGFRYVENYSIRYIEFFHCLGTFLGWIWPKVRFVAVFLCSQTSFLLARFPVSWAH